MNESEKQTVVWEIAPKSIFLILGIIAGLWTVILLKDVLVSLFIALIVTTALAPLVQSLHARLKLPFGLSMLIVYALLISVFVALGFIIIPPLFTQISYFITVLPRFMTTALENVGLLQGTQADQFKAEVATFISTRIGDVAQGAYSITVSVFSTTLGIISILVFSFYLLIEKNKIEEFLVNNLPFIKQKKRREILEITTLIEHKLGAWSRGQLALCLIIGVMTFIGLTILQIPFALPLAVIAGLLEIVPVIGPIISAIPAILVVLAFNPVLAIFVVLLYLIIQQLENNLVVPQVMKRAVGFSPLVSIIAIMIGSSVMGVAGALLAIPFVAVIFVIIEYYAKRS